MRVGLLALGVAAVALTGCTANDGDVVGRWEGDGVTVVFLDDRTFTATGLDVEELYDLNRNEPPPPILNGDWYPESWAENPFDEGHAIRIFWRETYTSPYSDAFQLVMSDDVSTLVINDWIDGEPVPVVELVRIE